MSEPESKNCVITPLKSCGPLRFGMTRSQASEAIGPADREISPPNSSLVSEHREKTMYSCATFANILVSVNINLRHCDRLHIGDIELLHTPLPDMLQALTDANHGIAQAQGGSLYFDELGLALLQFDVPEWREIFVYADPTAHSEPLKKITVEIALDYYRDNRDADPALDRLETIPR